MTETDSDDAEAAVTGSSSILVVGPNPAMDRTEEIREFRPHEVNRAEVSSPRAGGKSFIVARALRRLGHEVSAYGFLGGATGSYLRDECLTLGIRDRHTEIAGHTRINTILVDESTRLSTVINEPGPIVSPAEAAALTAAVADDLHRGDLLVLTGSLPRGADDRLYADLIRLARARGARTIVDAEGTALVSAAAATPWAIKCNASEFRALAADAPHEVAGEDDRARMIDAMQSIVRTGVELVVVTLGASGLIAATSTQVLQVSAPAVETKNATGSGDTFLAGFAAALAEGAELPEALRLGSAAASANAAVLIPDIGPDPQLEGLLERTRLQVESIPLAEAQAETLGARP